MNIKDFLDWVSIRKVEDDVKEEEDTVKLMTVHSAKGLEFKSVFIVGCNDGVFPMKRKDSDHEEERRIFYVGVTRAENHLTLTIPAMKQYRGKEKSMEVSPFVREMQNV